MFSPYLGRFLNVDPIGFAAGDVNLYRVDSNNPLNRLDPSGLEDVPSNPPNKYTAANPDKLSIKDFKVVNELPFGAFTAVKFVREIEMQRSVELKDCEYVATVRIKGFKIHADIDRDNSKVLNKEQPAGIDLLKHEQMHLKISQYVAQIYSQRYPVKDLATTGSDKDKQKAIDKATNEMQKRIAAILLDIKSVNQSVNDFYDAKDQAFGGGNIQEQAKWNTDFKEKVEVFLRSSKDFNDHFLNKNR